MINQDIILENLTNIFDYFGVSYREHNNRISFACPVHGSDNQTSASILTNSPYGVGIWKCWSNGCEQDYNKYPLGLIEGMLNSQKGISYTTVQTIDWLEGFLSRSIKDNTEIDFNKKRCIQQGLSFNERTIRNDIRIPRDIVLCSLNIPSNYFLKRGYSKDILIKYDVGLCTNKEKPMWNRIVVPSYDDDGINMTGCLGRTTRPQCFICRKFHDQNGPCPSTSFDDYKASKWVNSLGFNVQDHLYNYWMADKQINKYNTAILVEGAGDIWRLEEAGISIGLGLFGAHFTDSQARKLEKLAIHNLIIATDNDDAGFKVRDRIKEKVSRHYNIFDIIPNEKDIGDTPIEGVKELFNSTLVKLCKVDYMK